MDLGLERNTALILCDGGGLCGGIARQFARDEAKAGREGRPVEDISTESTVSIPAGRYGKPQKYADMVAFLASTRASYLNGSTIRVDGGFTTSI